MSHVKEIQDHHEICEQYSKSSSKRLFASVFRIIDHDELEVSSFDHCDTNGSRISSILSNPAFLQALSQKLAQGNLTKLYPMLKVRCLSKSGASLSMDAEDLSGVFAKFGGLHSVIQSQNEPSLYILFISFSSAYVAMKLMNNFTLRSCAAELKIQWCSTEDYYELGNILGEYHSLVDWGDKKKCNTNNANNTNNGNGAKQNKLTCRYDIQIDNEKQFQVARRIIGSKGINMKKIIQAVLEQAGENSNNSNQVLKLRLRGKGSGYKEGPEQMESEQELHLCISAKDQTVYNYACQSVQKLLQGVYAEYHEFTRKIGRPFLLTVKKNDIGGQSSLTNNENVMQNIDTNIGRMQASKIQQYLQMRNRARRELNFAEADRIRNYLRVCGVCLIDEKGRRGKAAEVTAWKYLF